MKTRGVYFTRSGAVVTKDVELISKIKNIVLNPDLTYVNNTNPKYWKLYEGHIVPMTDAEKKHRDLIIDKYGIDHTPILIGSINEDLNTPTELEKSDVLVDTIKNELNTINSTYNKINSLIEDKLNKIKIIGIVLILVYIAIKIII